MKTNHKYDPEDIESLLLNKQFNELYDEEREFVLQHVENEEEYESLRKTLFGLHDMTETQEWLEPDPSIRKALLKEFAVEKKGGFRIWLNSLFVMPEITWYHRPAVRVAFACAIVLIGSVVLINLTKDEVAVAENHDVNAPQPSADKNKLMADTNNLFAENLADKEIPPAPKTVTIIPPVTISSSNIPEEAEMAPSAEMNDRAEDLASAPVVADQVKTVTPSSAGNVTKKASEEEKEVKESTKDKKTDNDVAGKSTATDEPQEFSEVTISQSSTLSHTQVLTNTETISATSPTWYDSDAGAVDGGLYVAINTNSTPVSDVKDILSILYTAP